MPTTEISASEINDGMFICDILVRCNLTASKGEAKRLIAQNGISVDGEVISDISKKYTKEELANGIKIKKGKKVFHKAILG